MRVADITEFYSPRGGVRQHLTLKGRGFRSLGHDHLVIAPGVTNEKRILDETRIFPRRGSANVVLVRGPTLPYDSNYQLLWRIDRVHRILGEYQPDVVVANSLYMAALAIGTLGNDRAVRVATWHADFVDLYLQGFLSKALPKGASKPITDRIWEIVRRVLNGYAATFVASRSMGAKLKSRGIVRVIEIPYGVDRSLFRPEAQNAQLALELKRGDPNTTLAVASGRLVGEKSWEVVLEAIGRVRADMPLRLVLFGDGPEANRLRALAPADRVTFMGFESDRNRLAAAIASADLVLHSARNETYCFSVAEAVASGVPVIGPNSGAVPDLIDESHGCVCEATSPAAYAAAIERIVGPERAAYRANARAASGKVPDSSAQISEMARVYGELMTEHRPALAEAARTLDSYSHERPRGEPSQRSLSPS